jgi:6-phosphogluconolactonase
VATRIYVGTYSRRGSEGIYVFEVEQDVGALTHIGCAPAEHPSHLALSPDRRFLYAVNELNEFQGQPFGAASAFEIDSATGKLTFLNQQPVQGAGPCHVTVHPTGGWLVTSNYGGGTHSILPIGEDGRLGPLRALIQHGYKSADQPDAKAHSTLFSPDGRFLYACVLGHNLVVAEAFDYERAVARPVSVVKMPPGAGPRHQVLHPTLPILYVINELGSTVSVVSRDETSGALDLQQTVPTIPSDFTGRNACADLHLSPDGRFLYGSNRGHNSLAVFAIGADGLLSPIGHVSTGGDWPRGFGVLENGLILVANERSDNIVAFRIGKDGVPVPTGAVASVPCPVCVLPA